MYSVAKDEKKLRSGELESIKKLRQKQSSIRQYLYDSKHNHLISGEDPVPWHPLKNADFLNPVAISLILCVLHVLKIFVDDI